MKKYLTKRHSVGLLLKRREVLGFIGGTAAVSLVGCLRGESASSEPTSSSPNSSTNSLAQSSTAPACVVKPEQTEGPYFVDERLNRSDIRTDPSDESIKVGVPLQLVFQVSQISSGACIPLSNAIVDVWHCDAEGIYSDVNDRRSNTLGKKFLRGYQVTDANGIAQFATIYPGAYSGRAVHIHFKIRTNSTSQQNTEFTSQLYFDDALTDQIYTQPPYAAERQRTLNSQDRIFQNGGEQLTLQLTQAAEGYTGNFAIGLEVI